MPDQAYDLRRLATRRERAGLALRENRPVVLVVIGGKGGVGTTTVALNLAATMVETGRHALLVDADPSGGNAAVICGVEERYTLADVLADRRTWNEAACRVSDGLRLVVGQRCWHAAGSSAAAGEQLIERLGAEDLAADAVVIDAGSRLDGIVPHLCRDADAVLVVTTSDAASVVGAYAAMRVLVSGDCPNFRLRENGTVPCGDVPFRDGRLHILVNMAATAGVAKMAYERLARTCRRMFGIEPQSAGHLATVGPARKDPAAGTIGLKLQLPLADTLRRVLAVDMLSKWRRRTKFNATLAFAETVETDF